MRSKNSVIRDICTWMVIGLVGLMSAAGAGAEELSARQAKKLKRQADKQWKAGNSDVALKSYRELLEGVAEGNALHSQALYPVAVAAMASGDQEGLARGAELLDQYLSTNDQQDRLAAQAIQAWIDRGSHAEEEHKVALETLEGLRAELFQEVERTEQASADEKEDLDAMVAKLKSQVKRLRGELGTTKTELAKKEEALEKLKKVVVGGGS